MNPFDSPPTSGDIREVRVNLRPDTGMIFGILPDSWRAPAHFRVDGAGRPARYGLHWNGLHRSTVAADLPLLRARALSSSCDGDGHYECRRCIFFSSRVER